METTNIETQLQPLQNEIVTIKEKAEALIIQDDEQYNLATEMVGALSTKKKAVESLRVFFTAPLNEQVKNINGMFKPQIEYADEVIDTIKKKMAIFFNKKEEARIKEEKRLQDIRDAANAKREEKGQEAIAEPIREVAEVTRTQTTTSAQSTVKKVWTHEITSIDLLSDEVKKAIMAEAYRKGIITTIVQKFVAAGLREMPGVRIFQDTQIAVKTK